MCWFTTERSKYLCARHCSEPVMFAKAASIRRKSVGANDEVTRKVIRQLNTTLDFCGL